ncbi:MAG: tRNA adenosine(34) deaminase TadA [Burkholderiales bacterium]|jgi:tRNA(adenine34) deaminase|nr:tRNA adenosine(34) deaminase TadA [Burkholderiales bacterium]
MHLALEQACLAQEAGEVPVGAVIVDVNGVLLASAFNRTIQDHDPTGHAEVVALRNAAKKSGNHRLPGATLYVTLEPCVMCMGAMMHARLARVVFGAPDPKTGACGSVINLPSESRLNHHTRVEGGVLAHECGEILRNFFKRRRVKESQIEPQYNR